MGLDILKVFGFGRVDIARGLDRCILRQSLRAQRDFQGHSTSRLRPRCEQKKPDFQVGKIGAPEMEDLDPP
jgi:hypothetical protein